MKLQSLAAMLLLLGGLGCLSSLYSQWDISKVFAVSPVAATTAASSNNQAQRWEYNLVRVPIFFEPATPVLDNTVLGNVEDKHAVAQFAQLGNEGWELVAISNGVAVFKRPQ